MKKLLSIITITAFAAALPAGSFAAEKKDKAAAEKAADKSAEAAKAPADKAAGEAKGGTKAISYYGDVAAVDAAAKTFTFKNKDGKERVFSVGSDAKITKDGQAADFKAIAVGSYATGSYKKTADGKMEVSKVNIGPKPERKAKPAGEAKPADKTPEAKKAN